MKVWRKQASLRPSSCSSQQGVSGKDHHQNLCDRVDDGRWIAYQLHLRAGRCNLRESDRVLTASGAFWRDYQKLVARHVSHQRVLCHVSPSRWVKPSVKTIGLEHVWVHSLCRLIQRRPRCKIRVFAVRRYENGESPHGVPRWRRCGPRWLGQDGQCVGQDGSDKMSSLWAKMARKRCSVCGSR